MISKEYLSQSLREQADFIAKVIIMAQDERYNMEFSTMIFFAEKNGFFDKVAPGDPSHAEIKDLDNPIENGPSSPQN